MTRSLLDKNPARISIAGKAMETYTRKRLKRAAQPPVAMVVEQCGQVKAEQRTTQPAQWPFIQESTDEISKENSVIRNDIKTGGIYEIDHSHLPSTCPVQLMSTRVVMVCEKTDLNVAVRYPSMGSLRAFFNFSKRETHPTLDEKFVMSFDLAARLLVKLVPGVIFEKEKSLEYFWMTTVQRDDNVNPDNVIPDNVIPENKKGTCLSVLKESGAVNWGVRRQVKHLGRHTENDCSDGNAQNSATSLVSEAVGSEKEHINVTSVDGEEKCEIVPIEALKEEQDEEEEHSASDNEDAEENNPEEDNSPVNQEDEDSHPEEKEVMEASGNLKRKRYTFRNLSVEKPKKEEKRDIKKPKPKPKAKAKAKANPKKQKGRIRSRETLTQRDPKGRWSSERYKLAEKNLLAVMRLKGATAEKPILRPQLRAEARKKIGDTGLLDHLLKHMAGKLAPGSQERFRRRHNPDGAMEYWLESAELVNLRKEAGVSDPYWVPPPGWKIGDSPNQEPVCARELKLLKDEVSELRRQLELMATKVQLKEEVEKLWRELEKVNSGRKQEQYVASLISSLCNFGVALDSVENNNEQLMAISKFVEEMEGVKNALPMAGEEDKSFVS